MNRLHSTRVDEQNIDRARFWRLLLLSALTVSLCCQFPDLGDIDRVFRETLQKQEPKTHGGWKKGQLVTVLRGRVDQLP